jgi:menaquinol-cytochrome c reductase iron-sulfur subunit
MAAATWLIGAVISSLYAVPAIAYLVGPALRRAKEAWLPLGSTAKVEVGKPTLFKASIEKQTGWISDRSEVMAYVLTDNGRDYIAMSNICTHLGCRVRWIEERQQFFCPCHNGVFDRDGNVVSGPPPRPLDRYDVRVERDQLEILVT